MRRRTTINSVDPRGSGTASTGLCNCAALRRATRRVSPLDHEQLAASGLRSTQHSLLSQVERSGDLSMGALAEALVMDRSALGRTLKPLERDGLVAVSPTPRTGAAGW